MCILGIHHITHIDNLDGIIKNGILPRKILNKDNKNYKDTADPKIILEREALNLNEYIPFHINSIQKKHGIPYKYQVCKDIGKEFFIVLSLNFSNYNQEINKLYLYHPVSSLGREITNLSDYINKINEEYSKLPLNENGYKDYRNYKVQEFFMSEVLIKNCVPFDRIDCIYVFKEETEKEVNKILEKYKDLKIKIEVDSNFFR